MPGLPVCPPALTDMWMCRDVGVKGAIGPPAAQNAGPVGYVSLPACPGALHRVVKLNLSVCRGRALAGLARAAGPKRADPRLWQAFRA